MAPRALQPNILDRAIGFVSPRMQLARMEARVRLGLVEASYDAAGWNRRTMGWPRRSGDANATTLYSMGVLRDQARDLARNNDIVSGMVEIQANQVIGWGIKAATGGDLWRSWAETTACDADGRRDLYGLQHLAWETMTVSGECLVRRRWRRLEDGLPLPMQLQVLEPDYLDESKNETLPGGSGVIIQGVEFDPLGRRVAYWLFREHPGAMTKRVGASSDASVRVDARDVIHQYDGRRPGQVRGVTRLAPVIPRVRNAAEYEDGELMKQKIASCLSVFVVDPDGDTKVGIPGTGPAGESTQEIGPGAIITLDPRQDVRVVNPPTNAEYNNFIASHHRAIAAGFGVTYEDMTGNYQSMPFSASRMSWIRHWYRVDGWRWKLIVPQLLDPIWKWGREAAAMIGERLPNTTRWTPPPMPFIDPQREGLALMQLIRAGIATHSEVLRERGYDPDAFVDELARDIKRLRDKGLTLDIDAGLMTQAGQALNKSLLADGGSASARAGLDPAELARQVVAELVKIQRDQYGQAGEAEGDED